MVTTIIIEYFPQLEELGDTVIYSGLFTLVKIQRFFVTILDTVLPVSHSSAILRLSHFVILAASLMELKNKVAPSSDTPFSVMASFFGIPHFGGVFLYSSFILLLSFKIVSRETFLSTFKNFLRLFKP